MTTYVPQFADQKWASEPWCQFDVYQNPVRLSGGNPVAIMGNAGGGFFGTHRYFRDTADSAMVDFMRYLLGDYVSTSPAPLEKWDVWAVTTAQRRHSPIGIIRRSQAIVFPNNVRDRQRANLETAKISHLYGANPRKRILIGESFHGWADMLSQLEQTLIGAGHDSRVCGVLSSGGPVDMQNYGGLDYFYWTALAQMMGVRDDDPGEWNAYPPELKARASPIEWFRRRKTAGYPRGKGFLLASIDQGDHLLPIGDPNRAGSNPHDSRQVGDLAAEIAAAGLQCETDLITATAMFNTNAPGGPIGEHLELCQRWEAWMSAQINLPQPGP